MDDTHVQHPFSRIGQQARASHRSEAYATISPKQWKPLQWSFAPLCRRDRSAHPEQSESLFKRMRFSTMARSSRWLGLVRMCTHGDATSCHIVAHLWAPVARFRWCPAHFFASCQSGPRAWRTKRPWATLSVFCRYGRTTRYVPHSPRARQRVLHIAPAALVGTLAGVS